MCRTVPSLRDRPDGNCADGDSGRLVGRQADQPSSGIWLAVVQHGELVESRRGVDARRSHCVRQRTAAPPVIAGFDFSFGAARVVRPRARLHDHRRCVGARGAMPAKRWLAPTPPFWRSRCDVAAGAALPALRDAVPDREVDLPARRQRPGRRGIGARACRCSRNSAREGSRSGRSTRPAERTAFEIYPSALRKHSPQHDVGPWTSEHERDAVVSALRDVGRTRNGRGLEGRDRSDDRLEGDIWAPTPPQN